MVQQQVNSVSDVGGTNKYVCVCVCVCVCVTADHSSQIPKWPLGS